MFFIVATGLLSVSLLQSSLPSDITTEHLKDGFVRIKSAAYSVEVPGAWTVGNQTPWGARSITPTHSNETELGVMTAGVTKQSWDQLYKTSLFFILNQEKGTATPYKLSKTKSGYDACSFQVKDSTGFSKRRYVLLKNSTNDAIALSVTISEPKKEREITRFFERMVDTAHIGR